jgi:threonylcarbamoyladenosine tRNA methylthiotransferase MtaB
MNKVAFYTLGCKLNFSETSTLARRFENKGFKKVEFHQEPDIFVLNTCSVTENADKKCRKVVREALSISPEAMIIVTGCYAQLKPKEIASIKGVSAVFGAAEKFTLPEKVQEMISLPKPDKSNTSQTKAKIFAGNIEENLDFHHSFSINDRTRTFLKIQDGCNYNCTFCTIPLARGQSRSDSIESILKVAQEIAATEEVREIVLTGVNTGDFGIIDGKRHSTFLDLIRQLDQIEKIARFRISSIEPNLLHDEIIEFVAGSKKFVPHFHIPLQSGSDRILKLMRRRYLRDLYKEKILHIRNRIPDCCIGVDVITGFPGETEEDFIETYLFLEELEISYLHVFPYSIRENTPAQFMIGHASPKIRNHRANKLRALSETKRNQFYKSQVGKEKTVLFESKIEKGKMYGFTENYIKVSAGFHPELVNEMVNVIIDGIDEDGNAIVKAAEKVGKTFYELLPQYD